MGQLIYSWFYKKPSFRITIIGLGEAGKTTLMLRMIGESINNNIIPTMGSNFEMFCYNGVELNCWDLEGHGSRIRDLWVHYYKDSQCIIYVIDSNDKECIDENIYEIERLVTIQEAIGIPILFIANQKKSNGCTYFKRSYRDISIE